MSWLTPLGFLGLIGLIALIIIYIIKPNYQQKFISSTYVWKLSLKYKKKKLPINKFRNILTFIAQVLIITLCSALIAGPIIKAAKGNEYPEKVAIIDASASMWTSLGGETRFQRAVNEAMDMAEESAANDSPFSVIVAGQKASYLVQRATADNLSDTLEQLNALIKPNAIQCSYGKADVDGAMKLSESVLEENPQAEISFLTGKEYYDAGKVNVVDVSDINEWNAGILDVRVTMEENYYKIAVDVACYGKDALVPLYVDIHGANVEKSEIELSAYIQCVSNQVQTVTYWANFEDVDDENSVFVYMYESIHVHLGVDDNYVLDNNHFVYGGVKPLVKVQYYSTTPNNFYSGLLMAWRNTMRNVWDIEITEIKDVNKNEPKFPELSGFDLYLFENKMPESMPTDGIVLLINPDKAPSGSGLRVLGAALPPYPQLMPMEGDMTHPVMKHITAENIQVMMHANIDGMGSEGYETLMSCEGLSTVLVKNTSMEKVGVIGFSTKYSTAAITPDFSMLFLNMMNYFMPATVNGYSFDINTSVQLNARGESLTVSDPNGKTTEYTEFPTELVLNAPGVYTMSQIPMSGISMVENIYVKSPASESDITCKLDALTNPYFGQLKENADYDLVFYFAAAIVAFLFIEWWLQTREHF